MAIKFPATQEAAVDKDQVGGRRVREVTRCLRENLVRLCLWKLDGNSPERVWDYVEHILGEDISAVHKIQQVNQPDKRTRYDVYVESERSSHVLKVLIRARRGMKWYVREHCPGYHHRVGVVRKKHYQPRSGESFRICSYNVNTARDKEEDLGCLVRTYDLVVLALQETRRQRGQFPLHMRGFRSIESFVGGKATINGLAARDGLTPGENGMALLVRNDVGVFEVRNRVHVEILRTKTRTGKLAVNFENKPRSRFRLILRTRASYENTPCFRSHFWSSPEWFFITSEAFLQELTTYTGT